MEEIQILGFDGAFINATQCLTVGLYLRAVAFCHLLQSFLGNSVCFEVDDGYAVLFQKGAVHNTLEQYLLPCQTFRISSAVISA